jgi:hypothetical protein
MIALHHQNQLTKITPQEPTKQQNKPKIEKQENNFFDVLETPHLQQLSHRTELGFSAFIHKKHLTFFKNHINSKHFVPYPFPKEEL